MSIAVQENTHEYEILQEAGLLDGTILMHDKRVKASDLKAVKDTIKKIPTTGVALRKILINIKGEFADLDGFGGYYNVCGRTIMMGENQRYDSNLILPAITVHETMHHVWNTGRSLNERIEWANGIQDIINKHGVQCAPTRYAQLYFNYDLGIPVEREMKKNMACNEAHSEVGAYVHEKESMEYGDKVCVSEINREYMPLYVDLFESVFGKK